ncbi:metallophosphoesterase [Rhodopirellula europaea]|uniref:metallophosphoesterase n=1 Tax=Rhodopirellula europaea TaxID=1263866 RepID=UPI003D29BDEB
MIQELAPTADDELIFLGDYIDRGPDSRDVIDQLIQLQSKCKVIPLRGNHEWMLQSVVSRGLDDAMWLRSGGKATVTSYGGSAQKIPKDHLAFFESLLPSYETEQEIFVHAMYDPSCDVESQSDELTYWTHLPASLPAPHHSGETRFRSGIRPSRPVKFCGTRTWFAWTLIVSAEGFSLRWTWNLRRSCKSIDTGTFVESPSSDLRC